MKRIFEKLSFIGRFVVLFCEFADLFLCFLIDKITVLTYNRLCNQIFLPHNANYVVIFCPHFGLTSHEVQAIDLLAVDVAALHGIDARGVNGGVPENVREAHDVLVDRIIRAREKVAQIVRKDLALLDTRCLA